MFGGEGGDAIDGGAADVIEGGGGDDILSGGLGDDVMIGGVGDDAMSAARGRTVRFRSLDELTANTDHIIDFQPGAGIDAVDVSGIAGLSFIGQAAFTGVAVRCGLRPLAARLKSKSTRPAIGL